MKNISEEQNAYIKPADYEIGKKRKYKNDIYRKENLFYDETGDYFVCPNGKKLIFAYDSKRKVRMDMKQQGEITYVRTVQAVRTEKNATRENMKIER